MKKVTIRDLQAETGLSRSTISRALSNRGYVSDKNRALVNRAVEKLGYEYGRPRSVNHVHDLVMIMDELLSSPIHIRMIEGISEELARQGRRALIAYNRFDTLHVEDYLLYARDRRFAGVIILGMLETKGLIHALESLRLPLVLLNQELPRVRANVLALDDYQGGYRAADYLIKRGHRRIAFLTGYRAATAVAGREAGYREALARAGLPVDEGLIFHGEFSEESGASCARRFMGEREPVSAAICCSDMITLGCVKAIEAGGGRIPRDYSVIGFDESPYTTRVSGVKLSLFSYDFREIGRSAARLLLENMASPYMPPKKLVFSPIFVEGDSVRRV